MNARNMALLLVALLLMIIGAGGYVIYRLTITTGADPEVMMGMLVVVAIATLMTVLFIVAAGFSSMSLTDPKQALALPEGSIRAMIALVLIMVFIIFGIYLFRKVGSPTQTFLAHVMTPNDAKLASDRSWAITPSDEKDLSKGYNVWVLEPTNDEGKRLAQQLLTTVGTLVVAIASFYFGSTLAGASKKDREEPTAGPTIKDVTPKQGTKGAEISLEIEGTGFMSPTVRLVRGTEAMAGTEILSNPTRIHCKVLIDKDQGEKWGLIVENEDGAKGKLPEIFTIT